MPHPHLNIPSSNRRTTVSARQRENHPQNSQVPVVAASSRRRKSRSPETRAKRPATIAGPSHLASSHSLVIRPLQDEAAERGRNRAKPRARPHPVRVEGDDATLATNVLHDTDRAPGASSARAKRKERSRSREVASRLSRKAVMAPDVMEEEDKPVYTGPLAQADYHRMKQEVEDLRKQVAMSKKTINKQSKVIDELRAELTTAQESHRAELDKMRCRSKKSDEVVSSVESSLTCQICMELLLKPYGLSPCGHVLCMTCLLEWFKAAPPGDDEMHDDDYDDAILFRKKTCPCCRTIVRSRPIPLYLVKSIATTLNKAKAPAGTIRPSPPPEDEDPWAGIFRDAAEYEGYWSTDDDEDSDERDDEDVDEDEGSDEEEGEDDYQSIEGYGTGEDEDSYHGPYTAARWAPPTIHITPDDYPFIETYSEEFKILRRGATLEMIELFRMSYSHNTGLTAVVDEDNVVYLGWNIELHYGDDTGEAYMDWVLGDMYERPERWRVINDEFDGSWIAHKLVPRAEAAAEYDDTDSEMWTAESNDEDEDDEDM